MKRIRVIPTLLLHKGGLVKSVKFAKYTYVGDPINAVKIFNEKEVDELAVIDIDATRDKRSPDITRITGIVSEAFMPIAYGGGITHVDEVKKLLFNGVEKVILNKAAVSSPKLVSEIAEQLGSQSIVVSIDVKKTLLGKYRVFTDNGKANTGLDPIQFAKECEERGAGEILLNSVDRDGTYKGYDTAILRQVAGAVSIPVIACGGAGSIEDFKDAVLDGHASAVSAGSMFVFQRPHNAVLISYPSSFELEKKLYSVL